MAQRDFGSPFEGLGSALMICVAVVLVFVAAGAWVAISVAG